MPWPQPIGMAVGAMPTTLDHPCTRVQFVQVPSLQLPRLMGSAPAWSALKLIDAGIWTRTDTFLDFS